MNVNKVKFALYPWDLSPCESSDHQDSLDTFLSEREPELNPWFGPFLSNIFVYFVYLLNEHFVNALI